MRTPSFASLAFLLLGVLVGFSIPRGGGTEAADEDAVSPFVPSSPEKQEADASALRHRHLPPSQEMGRQAPEGKPSRSYKNRVGNASGTADEGAPSPADPKNSLVEPLATVREEDPEAFAGIVQRMEALRAQNLADSDSRRAQLEAVGAGFQTEEHRAIHQRLLETEAWIREYESRLSPLAETSPSEEECRRYFQAQRERGTLLLAERRNLLENFGSICGYDAVEFADAIESLYLITSMEPEAGEPPETMFR